MNARKQRFFHEGSRYFKQYISMNKWYIFVIKYGMLTSYYITWFATGGCGELWVSFFL